MACFIMERAVGVPKLTYLLWTCPAYQATELLARMDERFVAAFESILKISISGDALIQLTLPISMGGIGIPTPSELALPAFASSCHSVEPEVLDALGPRTQRVHLSQEADAAFATIYRGIPPEESLHRQAAWTELAAKTTLTELRLTREVPDMHRALPNETMRR